LKIGFSKSAVGAIAKTFGVWATITGGLVGGALILRLPIKRALVFFGLLQGVANLGFAVLAMIGPNVLALATVISLETLTAGMGTAALVALMASQTDKRFTATQYALLSSLMGVPRVLTGPPAGYLAEHTTWPIFFLLCTLMAIPGLLIISKIKLQPIDKSKSF
jgi:PAT family beta-lactamase induction signal transducer AmpG